MAITVATSVNIESFDWNGFFSNGYAFECDPYGFPEIDDGFKNLYPFKLRAIAYKGSPRDWGESLLAKRTTIAAIMDGQRLLQDDALTLYFPERWLGAAETGEFMNVLAKNHSYLQRVSIMTCNPIMITDFPNSILAVMEAIV